MPGAATADSSQRIESIKAEEMRFGMASQPVAASSGSCDFSFPNRGVSSSAAPRASAVFSLSWASSVSSFSSPKKSPLELVLASVLLVADDKTLPYELDLDGPGVCVGETRPERMLREFIVLSTP